MTRPGALPVRPHGSPRDIDRRCSPRRPGARTRTWRKRQGARGNSSAGGTAPVSRTGQAWRPCCQRPPSDAAEAQPPPGGARRGGARRGSGRQPRPRRHPVAVAATAGGGRHLAAGRQGFGGPRGRGAADRPPAPADRCRLPARASTVDGPAASAVDGLAAPAVGCSAADAVGRALHRPAKSAGRYPVVVAGHRCTNRLGVSKGTGGLGAIAGTVDACTGDGDPKRRSRHVRWPRVGAGTGDDDRRHRTAAQPARPSRTGATGVRAGARVRTDWRRRWRR